VSTNPTREQLLSRKVEINSELRSLRNKYSKPGATVSPADDSKAEDLIAELERIELGLEQRKTATPSYSREIRIGQEERTYRPDTEQTGGPSFFRDLALSQVFRDPRATERLARHAHEMEVDGAPGAQEQRAIGSGAVTGLVPPQYLTGLYAELPRTARPTADACSKLPLPPEGLTVNISRLTTGTSAAIQASEGAGVSETNADDTLLTVNVNTVAGQQTVSRQAVERGALVETVLMGDLLGAHDAALESQVINGSGSSGQHLGLLNVSGINAVTYTDASPTVPELWPKEVDAVRQVAAQRFTGATHIVMNPLMWGWHLSSLDTTGRPLFDVGGTNAMNTTGVTGGNAYQDRGTLLGARLLQSGGVPSNLGGGTNETRIIAVDMRDVFLWEDPNQPIYIKAEETLAANLQILYVIYSYSAFAAGRQPKAIPLSAAPA
jgi:HK97 family phage major capsid protein